MSMRRLLIAAMVLGPVGCSQTRVDPLAGHDPELRWPEPPDQPRVRWLGELTGSEDVKAAPTLGESLNALAYGPKPPSRFVSPYAVAVHEDGQRVAVADTGAGCVHVLDLERPGYARIEGCGPRGAGAFESPAGVAWCGDALWVSDAKRGELAVLPGGHDLGKNANDRAYNNGRWIGKDRLARPAGLAWCASNGLCYVADAGACAIVAFDEHGDYVFQFGERGAGPGQFNGPSHIACGPDDELVVADSLNFRVQRFRLDGTHLGMFGRKGDAAGDLSLPKGVGVDAQGHLWVVDAHFENIQAFTTDGELLMVLGREGREPGAFWLPAGLAMDSQQRVWVADTQNRRVQVFELLP